MAETSFKARTDEVLLLVKTLQQSTRVMQHTCSHFKTNAAKQIALARQVMALSLSLAVAPTLCTYKIHQTQQRFFASLT